MQIIRTTIIVMYLVLVAGCSGQKVRESLYGVRLDSESIKWGTPPAENLGKPHMNYYEYSQKREELIKRDQ